LKNNNLLVTEPGSNDLVLMNTYFQEKKRIQGNGEISDPRFRDFFPCSRSSNDGKYYIWFKGGSTISIVNTETLKFKDISIIKSKPFSYFSVSKS
jgi:hypothetical protein